MELTKEQKKEMIIELLDSRNFKKEFIDLSLTKTYFGEHKDYRGKLFFFGEGAERSFYSFMFQKLVSNMDTMIFSSSDLTKMFIENTYRHHSSVGVVLGLDLTKDFHEKVMAQFVDMRLSRGYVTAFLYPFTSLRKLETDYGNLFSELFKARKFTKVGP